MIRKTWVVATLLAGLLVSQTVLAQQAEGAVEDIETREGTDITFYGHIFSTGRGSPMPMNTQYPEGEDDYSRGIFGNCGTYNGVPAYVASGTYGSSGSCEEFDENENWWYTTAGFVQVKSGDEIGCLSGCDYSQFHNERGQTKDIHFDLSKNPHATYWMSADWHAWSTLFCAASLCWNWDPGYFQNWVVEATVYHGSLGEYNGQPSEAPDMGNIYNNEDATVIAYGRDGPKDLASFDPTIPADPLCGGPCTTVQPFDIELEFTEEFIAQGGVIPKEDDLVVRFQWYQEESGERYILSAGAVVGTSWNVNAGEDYPPQITFPVKNPLDVELVFPRFIHDKLVVLSVLNTPWGSYDVEMESIKLEVTDASGDVVPVDPELLQSSIESSVAHSGHYKPIDVTWVWDYQEQGLAPGDYTATVKARNFQGSYETATTATFTIEDDGTGGETEFGSSGLLSFGEEELSEYQTGSTSGVEAAGETAETQSVQEEAKDSPGPALPLLILGTLAVLLRRRAA